MGKNFELHQVKKKILESTLAHHMSLTEVSIFLGIKGFENKTE